MHLVSLCNRSQAYADCPARAALLLLLALILSPCQAGIRLTALSTSDNDMSQHLAEPSRNRELGREDRSESRTTNRDGRCKSTSVILVANSNFQIVCLHIVLPQASIEGNPMPHDAVCDRVAQEAQGRINTLNQVIQRLQDTIQWESASGWSHPSYLQQLRQELDEFTYQRQAAI